MRIHRPDIEAVQSTKWIYELDDNQSWYETPKAYEIWQNAPFVRLKRLPKVRILWVHTKEEVVVSQDGTQ